ncbi:hypothetical protein [Sulfitobacter sp. R18_1]|uniref:hypothetical protein n=1 Tax=Sulfitobacter sp. R18_1 TaxID=2821104 RepID=UPI001ADA20CE|nr:hypothetical protein [Sulfitobacter sp. R18_1]MBO9428080.1 hypothetical protein [Sulfitobacter sp. R18_1]
MRTSTKQSGIDFSRADHLQKDEVVSRKGLVDATLVQKMDEPKHLVDWYRLSNNEEIKIPAGCAMAFKVDGGWKKSHFFEDGRIVGPLVCAVDAVEWTCPAFVPPQVLV